MNATTSPAARVDDYRAFRGGDRFVRLHGWTTLALRGPDTGAFLQGLASQDLPPGTSARTYFLTDKGRPLALAWVRVAEDGASAWVVADEGARDLLLPHFERFRVMEDVEFNPGDGSLAVLGRVRSGEAPRPNGDATWIDVAPLAIALAPQAALSSLAFADPSVFEPWRLSAGLPRTGIDFDLDRLVTELKDPDAISLTKGCYVGQEVVARTSNRGQVRRHRVGFRFEGGTGPLPGRTEIRAGDKPVGFVSSSAIEPGSGEGLGMGYVAAEALGSGSELLAVQGTMTILLRYGPWPLQPR
jgi:folate-binding protein YgfZ